MFRHSVFMVARSPAKCPQSSSFSSSSVCLARAMRVPRLSLPISWTMTSSSRRVLSSCWLMSCALRSTSSYLLQSTMFSRYRRNPASSTCEVQSRMRCFTREYSSSMSCRNFEVLSRIACSQDSEPSISSFTLRSCPTSACSYSVDPDHPRDSEPLIGFGLNTGLQLSLGLQDSGGQVSGGLQVSSRGFSRTRLTFCESRTRLLQPELMRSMMNSGSFFSLVTSTGKSLMEPSCTMSLGLGSALSCASILKLSSLLSMVLLVFSRTQGLAAGRRGWLLSLGSSFSWQGSSSVRWRLTMVELSSWQLRTSSSCCEMVRGLWEELVNCDSLRLGRGLGGLREPVMSLVGVRQLTTLSPLRMYITIRPQTGQRDSVAKAGRSLFGDGLLVRDGVVAVPDGGVVVAGAGDHDGGHDGGDVEGGPLHHELLQQLLLAQPLAAALRHLLLDRDAPGVVQGVGLVAVVVGLDQEPVGLAQLVVGVHCVHVALDHHALVGAHARDDVVDRPADPFGLEALDCGGVGGLLLEGLAEEPDGGDGVVLEDADEVLAEVLGLAGVHVDGEGAVADAGEGEGAADHGVHTVEQFAAPVVLDVGEQLGQQFPHLEVQVAPVQHLALVVAHQDARAGLEGRELVEEVQEEDLVERQSRQLRDRVRLRHKVGVLELVLGVPLDAVEEALGDGEQVHEVDEAGEGLLEVPDDGRPPRLGVVLQVDLVGEGLVRLHRAHVRHHRRQRHCQQAHSSNQLAHRQELLLFLRNLPFIRPRHAPPPTAHIPPPPTVRVGRGGV